MIIDLRFLTSLNHRTFYFVLILKSGAKVGILLEN